MDTMDTTPEEKDLVNTISSHVPQFSSHVAKAAKKGNRVLGAIRRSFRYMDKEMLLHLYKAPRTSMET